MVIRCKCAAWLGLVVAIGATACTPPPAAAPVARMGQPRKAQPKTTSQSALSAAEQAESFRTRALRFEREGRLLAAMTLIERAKSIAPKPQDDAKRFEWMVAVGLHDEAKALLGEGLELSSDLLARAQETITSWEQARQGVDFDRAREELHAADALFEGGKHAEAMNAYESAWMRSGSNPMALMMAGIAARRANQPARANLLFARALVDAEKATEQQAALTFDGEPKLTPVEEGSPGHSSLRWQGESLAWLALSAQRRVLDTHARAFVGGYDGLARFGPGEPTRPVFWQPIQPPQVAVRSWRDDKLVLFEPTSGKDLATLSHPIEVFDYNEGYEGAYTFSEDRAWLLAGANDGILRLWDTQTHRLIRAFAKPKLDSVHVVAMSPDKRLVAGADLSKTFVWNAQTGELVDRWRPPTAYDSHYGAGAPPPISALAFSEASDRLAVAFTQHIGIRYVGSTRPPRAGMVLRETPGGALNWMQFDQGQLAYSSYTSGSGVIDLDSHRRRVVFNRAPTLAPKGAAAVALTEETGEIELSTLPRKELWAKSRLVGVEQVGLRIRADVLVLRGDGQTWLIDLRHLEWVDGMEHAVDAITVATSGEEVAWQQADAPIVRRFLHGELPDAQYENAPKGSRLLLAGDLLIASSYRKSSLWRGFGRWRQHARIPMKIETVSNDGSRLLVDKGRQYEVLSTEELGTIARCDGSQCVLAPTGRHLLKWSKDAWEVLDLSSSKAVALEGQGGCAPSGSLYASVDGDWAWARCRGPDKERGLLFWPLGAESVGPALHLQTKCSGISVAAGWVVGKHCPGGKATLWRIAPDLVSESGTLPGPPPRVVYVSPDGTRMATSHKGEVTVWSLPALEPLAKLVPVTGARAVLRFMNDKVEALGPERDQALSVLGCHVGPYHLPFDACMHRFAKLETWP